VAWLLIVLLALPLVATALSLLRVPRLAEAATLAASLGAFGLVVVVALRVRHGAHVTALDGWLRLDALGAVFLLGSGFLYAAGAIFSIGYLRADERQLDFAGFARRYFTYLNLFGWTMLLVPLMNDFATLWIAVELTTIVSVLLVALDRTDAALEAAWKYVLIASAGLGIALLSVVFVYAAGASALGEAYVPRFASLVAVAHTMPATATELSFLLAVVGFGTKVGLAPMHTWLPDAHSEAPARSRRCSPARCSSRRSTRSCASSN
jgi:hydrogenase-4 component F